MREDGEPLFIAKDVWDALGINNVSMGVSRLDDDQKITISNPDGNPRAGIPHTVLAVTESGLYDLTLDSRKPEARRVRKWVVEPELVEEPVHESRDLVPFNFSFNGNQVRTHVTEDGTVLFHGGDICRILGYSDSADAIKRHCKYAKKLRTGVSPVLNLNPRGELFIPEPDVYRLSFGSKMPFAEEFRDWICEVVIPTLRKTGGYQIGPHRAQVQVGEFLIRSGFSFKGNQVRTHVTEDGTVLFHGGDICRILGYANGSRDIQRHCKYATSLRSTETVLLDLNPRGELFIPESDVYRLTFGSKMPFAEEFRDWICEVVIPTLRRTGRYEIGPPADQVPEMPKAESIQAKF